MTGREIASLAFELKPVPRVPVTLVGGGAWAVHRAGKTFAQIKNDPDRIADIFIRYYRQCRHDLLWTGSNFLNYPIHFLGCPVKDDSSDYPALEGSVLKSLDEMDHLSIEKVVQLIAVTKANIRSEGHTKAAIVTTVQKGTSVEKIKEAWGWYNVRLSSGQTGWILKELVRPSE